MNSTCPQCNKQFKSAQGLKTHIRASKTCKQNNEIYDLPQNQPIFEVIENEYIVEETIFELPQVQENCEYLFDLENQQYEYMVEETIFELPQLDAICEFSFYESSNDEEQLTNQSVSQVFEMNKNIVKCDKSVHCETCTCFIEPVKVDQVSTILKNMAIEKHTISNDLPKIAIRDVNLFGDKFLETDQKGDKILRNIKVRHYNSPVITTKIVKDHNFDYEMRWLSKYQKQEIAPQPTYLNFKNGLTEYEAIMKYTIENNIQYCAKSFNPTMISFDVEAFHPTDKNCVPSHLNGGVISMICATFSKVDQMDRFVVYILQSYKYDEIKINEFMVEQRTALKLQNVYNYTLKVKVCENQTIMACQFLDDVKECGISLLYGFNSSATSQKDVRNDEGKITSRVSIGYDLPFIIHNSCRYTQLELENGCKMFGKIGKQIKRISWLPNTYILDCLVVFQNDRYFATKLSDMPNRKLNSFLEQSKLPLKLDDKNIYERMDQMRINGSDQSDCVNYCLWDCYALTQIMSLIKFVETTIANVEIFNIPLSWALHKNATNWITMYYFRRYFKKGFAFSYAKFPMDSNKLKYRGATTENCQESLQMSVIDYIAMWDFQSLYPSSIIAANLGIDSILDENDGNCYSVDLNFVDPYLVENTLKRQEQNEKLTKQDLSLLESTKTPNVIYFSKNPSLYATIIAEILQLRLKVKSQMKGVDQRTYDQLDARQNALKIFVNTIYGLSGSETFQLNDMRVAAACTSISRQLTYYARQSIEQLKIGEVVFRDTDSCGVKVNIDTIASIYEQSTLLNDLINEKLQQSLGNTYLVKFVLEGDTFQEKTYFPKAKKAYARIECDLQKIISKQEIQRDVKIKGVSWSLMSTYGKEFFKFHTAFILQNLQSYEQIQEYVNRILNEVQNDIAMLINTKNYSEICRKYHKQIKNSNSNNSAIYLKKTFNVTDNEIQILPIIKSCKMKSRCIIPATLAHMYQIDQNQLLDWFISPFVKFYGKHEYEQQMYDDMENLIEVRYATAKGYAKNTKQMSLDDLSSQLDNTAISYNEIIKAENKLYFDIDDSKNALNFRTCLDEIEKMICRFKPSSINVDYSYTKSTSLTKPHSYHVVYQIRSSMYMNKYIACQVNKKFDFEILDEAVYSLGKSLRLPNCPKYDETNKKLVQVYHKVVQGTVEQMFITDIENVQNSLSNGIGFINQQHKSLGYTNIELSDEYLSAIKSYIPFAVNFHQQNRGSVTIEPQQKPYDCPVCHRNHTSVNLIAYVRKDGFNLTCWSNSKLEGDAKKTPIKHLFEAKTEIGQQQKRLENLKKCIKTEYDTAFSKLDRSCVKFQNNKSVQYDLSAQTTFVKSAMGSSKTKQQILLTQNNPEFPTILALSFRRTFARDNASKNGFVNYESIQGEINLIDYPKVILQVDSLARLNTSVKPSLLILDEIESTIEQLLSIQRDTSPYILYKFIELLQTSTKILCMDAELEQSTIQALISIIRTDNYKLTVNKFQPKTDHTIYVHDFVSTQQKDINKLERHIAQMMTENKKIVIFCTGQKLAMSIQSKIPSDKVIKYYDGEDAKKINGVSQALIKQQDFVDVNNAWKDCDVLIYTGTLTAGISFELQHFDTFVGIFQKETSSALGFTQGLHRVRNFFDKSGHVFIENQNGYKPETPFQITDNQTQIYGHSDLSETNQLANWITASTNQSGNHKTQIIIRNIKNMGYKLEIVENQNSGKVQVVKSAIRQQQLQDIVTAQITVEDLVRIPKLIKNNAQLCLDTDELLQAKFNKVRIFKSFFPTHDQASIDSINKLDFVRIERLFDEQPRIKEGNKIKNIVKKCLDVRPEYKDLQIDQMEQIIKACQLESKSNLTAQIAGTVQKDSILKFHEQIYIVKQAIKVRDLMVDLKQQTLETALKSVITDTTLKNIGFGFGKNGVHHKLNEILKHIDIQINIQDSKRSIVDNKKVAINTYSLQSISAETILAQISESTYGVKVEKPIKKVTKYHK